MSEKKWLRSSLSNLSQKLNEVGHQISPPTVGRLLRKAGYSLRVNVKKREASATHPERNSQFEYIEMQKYDFLTAGWPVISVDGKKKELIGNYKQAGQAWVSEPENVNVHDFGLTSVTGKVVKAIPYGIYDLANNRGSVYLGQSGDTGEFAVAAIEQWWVKEGRLCYPKAQHLLILADGGGSNGWRPRLWKQQLQQVLCDRLGLKVTVCHYPTGCSKWNPIEHRLFGPISLNWAGKPLRTFEIMLAYLRGTTTKSGLKVRAELLEGEFKTGLRFKRDAQLGLNLQRHTVCPDWNYSILPRQAFRAVTPLKLT